ncbi:Tetratricopeptide-like helical domain containing protein [Trema orientale]|uniref:Tetratricopeptide-like helical domain containing protein n=1 Tax=Trema orientale TaxID=63057 RepID=A0A2P5BU27_TREOI|nr:Tetratricopeptide-like helical domain containing protein [Trema orientale]
MIRRSLNSLYLFCKSRRALTSWALPMETTSDTSFSTIANDHKSLCLTLAEQLIRRGLLSSAQQVIQRLVSHSSSVSDAIWVANFGIERGLDLGLGTYGALIKKLVGSGQHQLAEVLYHENVRSRGIDPDPLILTHMVICFCTLGKLEEASFHLSRLLMKSCAPCKATCNSLLQELYDREMILDAFDFFVWISNARVFLGFWCNRLIDRLCNRGYMDEALQVFDIMREKIGYLPTVHMYKTLFYGFCKRGWVFEAELLFAEMESQGVYIDKTMYTSLISEYCKSKKMKMAMRVLLRMLKTGCEPDNRTCNTLIHGFMKLGLFEKGWVISKQMIELGMQPDVITCGIMISEYCKEGKCDSALMLLNTMVGCNVTPSVHCYTVLINALHRENRFMEIDELYESMLNSGVVPDHVLYFTLLRNYPKGHEFQLAHMVLQAIGKIGCGIDPSVLSASTHMLRHGDLEQEIEILLGEIVKSNINLAAVGFSVYILALCMDGKTNAALNCLNRMASLGCKPLLFTYNSLIKSLCQDGLFEDVESLIAIMEEQGVIADRTTYLIMINGLCKQGDLESALGVLDHMDDMGMKPGVAIYDSIIDCLGREKRVLEAESMFKRMLEEGVDPDEVVYTTMIMAYLNNGRVFEGRQLFEKMMENSIQPSMLSYTALISGLVKRNMTDKGCIYLARMLRDGVSPNVVLYTSLISHSLKKGKFEYAVRLVDLMDNSQIEFDLVSYIVLVSGVCRNIPVISKKWHNLNRNNLRAWQMLFLLLHQSTLLPKVNYLQVHLSSSEEIKCFAVKLIQKIQDTRFMPNLYLYNGIISGFCWAQRMQEAYDNFESMQRQGLRPNQVTYTILMNGHVHSGDIDSAIGIFNKMNADGCDPDRIAYNTLLRGLCKAGRPVDALTLSYTMRKRGVFLSKLSYESLLNCFCASNLDDGAFKLFEEMIASNYIPRRFNRHWLLSMLCEKSKLREAQIVFDTMLEKGQAWNYGRKRVFVES